MTFLNVLISIFKKGRYLNKSISNKLVNSADLFVNLLLFTQCIEDHQIRR